MADMTTQQQQLLAQQQAAYDATKSSLYGPAGEPKATPAATTGPVASAQWQPPSTAMQPAGITANQKAALLWQQQVQQPQQDTRPGAITSGLRPGEVAWQPKQYASTTAQTQGMYQINQNPQDPAAMAARQRGGLQTNVPGIPTGVAHHQPMGHPSWEAAQQAQSQPIPPQTRPVVENGNHPGWYRGPQAQPMQPTAQPANNEEMGMLMSAFNNKRQDWRRG